MSHKNIEQNLMKTLCFTIFGMLLTFPCWSQKDSLNIFERLYEWRIKQQNLHGVYIPKDINEALRELHRLTDSKSKAKFKMMHEDSAAVKLFFSLGRWMTYNWSFYEGSRLSAHLRSKGIYDPDDMSRYLIILFNRSVNQRPLEEKELILIIQEKALERKKR